MEKCKNENMTKMSKISTMRKNGKKWRNKMNKWKNKKE